MISHAFCQVLRFDHFPFDEKGSNAIAIAVNIKPLELSFSAIVKINPETVKMRYNQRFIRSIDDVVFVVSSIVHFILDKVQQTFFREIYQKLLFFLTSLFIYFFYNVFLIPETNLLFLKAQCHFK